MRKSNGNFSIAFGVLAITLSIILITTGAYFVDKGIQLETVVGLIGIASGLAGIFMGISGNRKANLESVKEYFDKGDSETLYNARQDLANGWRNNSIDMEKVSSILNFYQQWGLLNRKGYLPIWVFSGASGVRVVEMYLQSQSNVILVRENAEGTKIKNPFYAEEFELLALRIFKKYKDKMIAANLTIVYSDQLYIFLKNQ